MKKVMKVAVNAVSAAFCTSKPPLFVPFRFDPQDVHGWKQCRKRLKASKDFSLEQKGSRIYGKNGQFIDGIAQWGDTIAFEEGGHLFRYKILYFLRNDRGYGFAIRAVGNMAITELPGIDLDKDEVKLLCGIAHEISEPGQEVCVKLPNIARKRTDNAVQAEHSEYSEGKLLHILQGDLTRNAFLIGCLGALECYLKRKEHAPFLVNFLLPRGSGTAAAERVHQVLRVVDFVQNSPYDGCAAIEIKACADLRSWERRGRRLTLLRYANEKVIRPIWREAETAALEERETNFPALPILLGSSSLPPERVFEISVATEASPLTVQDIQTLRASAAYLLSNIERINDFLGSEDHWRRVTGVHYILTYPSAFMQSFARVAGRVLFSQKDNLTVYMDACEKTAFAIQDQLESDQRILDQSLQLLLDPKRYASEIIAKPDSKEEAEEELAMYAVAFRHEYKGSSVLCFTESSLLRLLSRQGLTVELFDRFINLLKSNGVIEQKTKSYHFKNSSNMRFVTIPLQKCKNFNVTAITGKTTESMEGI